MAMKTKRPKNTSYSHMRIGYTDEKNNATNSSFSSMRDVAAITRKTKVVGVVANMAADVMAEKAVTIPHKPMKMPTPRRTRVLSSVTLMENMDTMG